MIHIGLFEGIGGFSLAAKWAGWKTYATCEIAEFPQKILKYHFPSAYHHGDIKSLNYETINIELSARFGNDWRNHEIILTGGFPCQPYSSAGKRLGKEDERHLWPEMLRIIREVRPTWIVGENVFGLVNWSGGLVFQEVQTDLEAEGYEVQPFILPAASVGAPHRRDRVWFVAYTESEQSKRMRFEQSNVSKQKQGQFRGGSGKNGNRNDSYADNKGLEGRENEGKDRRKESNGISNGRKHFAGIFCPKWEEFPTQSAICGRNDGISFRLDDITFSKWRNESIKAYGNAIVPQVALQIFKAINEYNERTN